MLRYELSFSRNAYVVSDDGGREVYASPNERDAREYVELSTLELLTDLYDRCARLRWHRLILGDDYETSAEYGRLGALADALGDAGRKLFSSFKEYHGSGPAFGTERAPMPERPFGQLTIV